MTRIVGTQDRPEFEFDPVKAYRRGLVLDQMLRNSMPSYPRGVTRGTHEYFNRIDDARRLQMARCLNAGNDE